MFASAEGSIWRRPLVRGRADSPGSLAQGMLHRDGPGTEESSPSPLTPGGPPPAMGREERATKGRPEEARTDVGAVLRPHSTGEGGEPQGSRKGRPRDPLEGRGCPSGCIGWGKHSRDSELGNYVPVTRPTICIRARSVRLRRGGESALRTRCGKSARWDL